MGSIIGHRIDYNGVGALTGSPPGCFFNEFIMTHTQKITVPGAKIKNEMTVGYRIHMQ